MSSSGSKRADTSFGAPIAYAIGAGFIPVRKPGKLPYEKLYRRVLARVRHQLAGDSRRRTSQGERVLVVDDLLATGGTAAATARLLERLGAKVEAFAFLIELRRSRRARGA